MPEGTNRGYAGLDMSKWVSRGLAVGLLAALVGVATSGAGAQSAVGPCAPGTVTSATVTVQDSGGPNGGSATATHSLLLQVDFGDSSVVDRDSIQFSAPPPATLKPDGPSEFSGLFDDTPGPVPITVTWLQSISGSIDECSAGTSATIQLQAPVPVHLSKPPIRDVSRGGWEWVTRIGPHADRRPIEVRVRGVRKAKLPGSQVPFKIATVSLRAQDPGLGKTRYFRTPRFLVTATYQDRFELVGEPRTKSVHEKPLGYEILVLQAGHQLAHIRAAGKCGDLFGVGCTMRIVKIQR